MILTVCANPSVDSFWAVGQIAPGATIRSQKETFHPGGKGIHTALALNELGENVTTLGLWGGQTGQWIKKECSQQGIATTGPSVGGWSRLCITLKSDTGWDDTELLGHGPDASEADANKFKNTYKRFLATETPKAVLISGSAPGGFDDNLYAQMIIEAKENEIPAFVDASGALLKNSLTARPHGIHVNQSEGQALTGKENPVEIVRWLADYTSLAAVTDGEDGLYLQYKDTVYHAYYSLKDNDIYSTIGAGDCLLAGLCLATLKSDDPSYWAKFAVACGSANCICLRLGMLAPDDVYHIVDQVNVEKR